MAAYLNRHYRTRKPISWPDGSVRLLRRDMRRVLQLLVLLSFAVPTFARPQERPLSPGSQKDVVARIEAERARLQTERASELFQAMHVRRSKSLPGLTAEQS